MVSGKPRKKTEDCVDNVRVSYMLLGFEIVGCGCSIEKSGDFGRSWTGIGLQKKNKGCYFPFNP